MMNKEMSKLDKVLFGLSTVGSVIIVILIALQVVGLCPGAFMLYLPMMGLVLLCHAILNWNKMRSVAVFCLCVAIFLLLLCGIAFMPV